MGWNFRRSKKIAPGVRLNLGKKSWGISFGSKHSRIIYNSKNGVSARTSIPGTGISFTQKLSDGKKKGGTQADAVSEPRASKKPVALWVLAVIFAVSGIGNLPKSVIGGACYILAAAAMLPIPAVRLRGWVKAAVAVALIGAGTALITSGVAGFPGQADNPITLVAGEQGEYGEQLSMSAGTEFEETFYIYRVPGGAYSVTNAGEYPAQVSVYEGIRRNAETGFDEYSATGDVLRLEVGESGEINVPDGWFIEIHEPDKVELVRTGDADGTP